MPPSGGKPPTPPIKPLFVNYYSKFHWREGGWGGGAPTAGA
jgi:hypothetical protein